jgi:hypothetical protein
MYINYLIVLLAFTMSFSSPFLGQSQVFNEFSTLVAGYFLAVSLMVRSRFARKTGGDEPLFGLGVRFLICVPPASAAPLAIGATIYYSNYVNFCKIFQQDCLSLELLAGHYLPNFAVNFVFVTGEFYAVILAAFLFCQLIHVLERKL